MQNVISENKFSQPETDLEKCIFRQRLMDRIDCLKSGQAKVICIDGQAGQGKTTAALQYLNHKGSAFRWYRVDKSDATPDAFAKNLVLFLNPLLPESGIKKRHNALNTDTLNAIFREINCVLTKETFFAFDDTHLLFRANRSLEILDRFISLSSPNLRFVVISRRPFRSFFKSSSPCLHTASIENKALAFTRNETTEYINNILKIPIPAEALTAIHKRTGGWPAGIQLLCGIIAEKGLIPAAEEKPDSLSIYRNELRHYFSANLLSGIPAEVAGDLYKLSLINEIPLPLAEMMTGKSDIGNTLMQLAEANGFVYLESGERTTTFSLNPLLKKTLSSTTPPEMDATQCRKLLKIAGAWYLKHNRTIQAIDCFLNASEYEMAESLLSTHWATLYAVNRLKELKQTLDRIVGKKIITNGWIPLITGIVHFDINPDDSFQHLKRSKALLAASNDQSGELLAACQLILYHAGFSGHFHKGKKDLNTAGQLFSKISGRIDVKQTTYALFALATGNLIFKSDTRSADTFFSKALKMAEDNKLDNFSALILILKCYRFFLAGNLKAARDQIEKSHCLLFSPHISEIAKRHLGMVSLELLAMAGDFENYAHRKNTLAENVWKNRVKDRLADAMLDFGQINIALAQGENNRAFDLIINALASKRYADNPHILSRYTALKAYLYGILKYDIGKVREAAEEAARLRRDAGGEHFSVLCDMTLGACYARAGQCDLAEKLLTGAILTSETINEGYLRAAAYAHRAYSRLSSGKTRAGLKDLEVSLSLMKKNDYIYFLTWTPGLMNRLLKTAVTEGIETAYAKKLASERLGIQFINAETVVPILKIRTFGQFEMTLDGRKKITAGDLTASQLEFLSLLISLHERPVKVEEIELFMWPDISEEKARSRFDNLISRFRKILSSAFAPHLPRHYLIIEKGMVRLDNCEIDAVVFEKHIRNGFDAVKNDKQWSAENCFSAAHRLWQGECLPGICLNGPVWRFQERMMRLYIETILEKCRILSKTGLIKEAITITAEAVSYDPTNDTLIRTLYNLHITDRNPVRADRVLKRYARALKKHNYTSSEIRGIIESIWEK